MEKKKLTLIGVSGKIGAGKDTVGEIIQSISPKWVIKKFASPIKELISKVTGIPVEDLEKEDVKNSYLGMEWSYIREERFVDSTGVHRKPVRYYLTPRTMMQKLGTEVGRQVHTNFWVNALLNERKAEELWIITDVRFPNEAEAITENGGILIRVNRKTETKDLHQSEASLDHWKFDYSIDNNSSIADLRKKVEEILIKHGIERKRN